MPGGFIEDGYDEGAFDTSGFWVPTTTPVSISGRDHMSRAIARLPEQFKKKPDVVNLLATLSVGFVSIEDALYQLLTQRSVETAIGTQLDVVGQIVGQPRDGLADDVYRRYIRARVATNRSRGRPEDMIRIVRLLLSDLPDLAIAVETQGVATAVVHLSGEPLTDALAEIVWAFLQDARAAGVRLLLESQPDEDSETFALAAAAFTTTSTIGLGASSVIIEDLEDATGARLPGWFPNPGTALLDRGTVDEEYWPYNGTVMNSNGTMTLLSSTPFAKAHASGSSSGIAIQRVDGLDVGLGTSADLAQPTLTAYGPTGTDGGKLADVR